MRPSPIRPEATVTKGSAARAESAVAKAAAAKPTAASRRRAANGLIDDGAWRHIVAIMVARTSEQAAAAQLRSHGAWYPTSGAHRRAAVVEGVHEFVRQRLLHLLLCQLLLCTQEYRALAGAVVAENVVHAPWVGHTRPLASRSALERGARLARDRLRPPAHARRRPRAPGLSHALSCAAFAVSGSSEEVTARQTESSSAGRASVALSSARGRAPGRPAPVVRRECRRLKLAIVVMGFLCTCKVPLPPPQEFLAFVRAFNSSGCVL